jgi:hypothetical protein
MPMEFTTESQRHRVQNKSKTPNVFSLWLCGKAMVTAP